MISINAEFLGKAEATLKQFASAFFKYKVYGLLYVLN